MDDKKNNQDTLSVVSKSIEAYSVAVKAVAIESGADSKSLKALDKSILFKGGVLGIAQIAVATSEEGAVGGIDKAISVGVGIVTGLVAATFAGTGIVAAGAVLGGGWGRGYKTLRT